MNSIATCQFVSKLHKNPQLIRFATTAKGKVLLWAIATALLWPSSQIFWISPLLALFLVQPSWRRELLCLGSVAFLYHSLVSDASWLAIPVHLAVMVGTLLLVYAVYCWARDFRSLPALVQRRPVVILQLVLWPLMIAAWVVPPWIGEPWRNLIDPFRWILPLLCWRLSYLLLAGKRGNVKDSGFLDHVWYCVPCFGGTNVPYGKGSDYLNANRVDESDDIAAVQLSGIKLLVLSKLWFLLMVEISAGVYGGRGGLLGQVLEGRSLGLTRLGELIGVADTSTVGNWGSIFGELIYYSLSWAATGHLIIGCLRLFGFRVFRNTYKPLLAETVVDFWNRFYYYFKELLVEFFFYPTFASYFKKKPKLRMFAAVMCAACLGNIYYHVMRDMGYLGRAGPTAAFELLLPHAFYTLLLGLGVFISMHRQQSRRGLHSKGSTQPGVFRLRNIAMVWLFYSLIHIWNVDPMHLSFGERTRFFFSLFGLA